MNSQTRISSKGQVVIPKEIRESLHLKPGEVLNISREGRRIVLEPVQAPRERISYEEFRRRVPRHKGPPLSIEDMKIAVDRMFAEQGKI
jgi:AbrB family looped-hinge helix DNA binding protein